MSASLSVCLSVRLSLCLSVCLSLSLSVSLSVCLSVLSVGGDLPVLSPQGVGDGEPGPSPGAGPGEGGGVLEALADLWERECCWATPLHLLFSELNVTAVLRAPPDGVRRGHRGVTGGSGGSPLNDCLKGVSRGAPPLRREIHPQCPQKNTCV